MKFPSITALLVASALFCGCSHKGHPADETHGPRAALVDNVEDYDRGYELGRRMTQTCVDSVAVQSFLLEFHAACSEGSESTARDMRYGFQDYVEEHDPELAKSIF